MTAETAQADLTIRTFLLGGGPEDDSSKIGRLLSQHDLFGAVGGDLSRLTRQGREAATEGLASATAGLLDIDVGNMLIYGWRTREQLIDAARRTARVQGRQEVVQLGSHQISSTLHPTIDLLVDGVRVHTFRFELSVLADIEVAALTVLAGRLTGLRAGGCTLTCALVLQLPRGDEELVKEQKKIDPHAFVSFGRGISLVAADNGEAATAAQRSDQAVPSPGSQSMPSSASQARSCAARSADDAEVAAAAATRRPSVPPT